MDDMNERLERLEAEMSALQQQNGTARRQARLWRGVAGGTVALALLAFAAQAGIAGNAATPSTVKLPFRVVNDQGKTVFDIDADKEGPRMRLLDAGGSPRAVIYGDPLGGHLAVFNKKGGVSAGLTTTDTGGAMSVGSPSEKPAVVVFSDKDGGAVVVFNKAEESVAGLITTEAGGHLAIFDKAGKDAADIQATPEGGKLNLYDKAGKVVGSQP